MRDPDHEAPRWTGERLPLAGDDLLDALGAWAATLRVDEAAAARSREKWLRRQSEEESTFTGVLADLADRGRPVLVHAGGGRRHRGTIAALGADFVALRTERRTQVLLRSSAVTAVRPHTGETPALSGRVMHLELPLADALAHLATDRPRVHVVTSGGDNLSGELRSVGTDVLTLRLDGDGHANVYVALPAVLEVASGG